MKQLTIQGCIHKYLFWGTKKQCQVRIVAWFKEENRYVWLMVASTGNPTHYLAAFLSFTGRSDQIRGWDEWPGWPTLWLVDAAVRQWCSPPTYTSHVVWMLNCKLMSPLVVPLTQTPGRYICTCECLKVHVQPCPDQYQYKYIYLQCRQDFL